MSATGSYALPTLADPTAPSPRPRRPGPSTVRRDSDGRRPDGRGPDAGGQSEPAPEPESADEARPAARVDLTGLSVAGITRRRVGWVSAALVAAWIVVVFARQVGDAQSASNRATQLAADNEALAAEVQDLQGEMDLVTRPGYVAMEARGYGLGNPREIPFTLDPTVPPPVDGAPGSAAVRLGTTTDRQTPLESWLQLLFGPTT
jgi:cell division protein FtsB